MINTVVSISHVLLALLLVILILIQRGKGADAGAAFGAGASGTVFGAAGSGNFFSRTTAVLATLFFATSLSLAYLSGKQAPTSIVEQQLLNESVVVEDEQPELMPLPDQEMPDLPNLEMPSDTFEESDQDVPQ